MVANAIRPKASGNNRRVRMRFEARRIAWLPPRSIMLHINERLVRAPIPSPTNFEISHTKGQALSILWLINIVFIHSAIIDA